MIRFIIYLWQLPQCVVGFIYLMLSVYAGKTLSIEDDGQVIRGEKLFNSVCLGELVFLKTQDENTRKHEMGHRKQSRILGPLYLLVVGLPSLCLNIIARFSPKVRQNYFTYFPEKWADKLGGVER